MALSFMIIFILLVLILRNRLQNRCIEISFTLATRRCLVFLVFLENIVKKNRTDTTHKAKTKQLTLSSSKYHSRTVRSLRPVWDAIVVMCLSVQFRFAVKANFSRFFCFRSIMIFKTRNIIRFFMPLLFYFFIYIFFVYLRVYEYSMKS